MPHMGLIGLGVMGCNLALNLLDHGVSVVGYDPMDGPSRFPAERRVHSVAQLVAALPAPRLILLLIPAGSAVDQQIAALQPLLSPGDWVVDGGNSHFRDTIRRSEQTAINGIHYIGMGISGGAEGARRGPAMMADSHSAMMAEIFQPVAARANGQACFGSFGGPGAGHFVKMIHNGIEYAYMQAIAEAVHLLRHGLGLPPIQIADLFHRWNDGPLASYLMEITANILTVHEDDCPLIDLIVDEAGQKGTGHWAVSAAMELGVPVPALTEAVNARNLSAATAWRQRTAAPSRQNPPALIPAANEPDDIRQALVVGKICAYGQGFAVLHAAQKHYWPDLPLDRAARIWQGGCIIRSALLESFAQAVTEGGAILQHPALSSLLQTHGGGLRLSVLASAQTATSCPVLASSLHYLDGLAAPRLWADVIQAQRDYFGAHGFRRLDRDGNQHGPWIAP